MAAPVIVVGALNSYNNSRDWAIYKFDAAGNVYIHGDKYPNHGYFLESISGIAIDSTGAVYVSAINRYTPGSTGYDDQPHEWTNPAFTNFLYPQWTVRKYNPDGVLIWTVNTKSAVSDICIDSSGNVYVIGDPVNASGVRWVSGSRTGYYTTRKYNNSGVLQWAADHGYSATITTGSYNPKIAVDASGNVYTGGRRNDSTGNLVKYNSSGVVQWQTAIDLSTYIADILIDGSGNVYACGSILNGGTYYRLVKYNSSGTFQAGATYTNDQVGRAMAFDSGGDIILGCHKNTGSYPFLFRYDSGLTLLATQAADYYTILITGMAIDDDDVVYLSSRSTGLTGSAGIWSVDTVGTFGNNLWTVILKDYEDSSMDGYCIALAEVETPPLKIPLALGTPNWIGDFYQLIPALAIPLNLGTPYVIRDYVGLRRPIIYRLYMTGGTGPVEFPLSSLQIRVTATAKTLSAVLPGIDMDDLTAIEDRTDGTIQIYRGVRFADGSEQIDLLLEVEYDQVRYDGGSASASITLSGSIAPNSIHVKTRTLSGISYRSISDGIRRVRCAIDTYLQVGDTADLGGDESLIVGEITIAIGPDYAFMEIAEVEL